LQIVRMRDAAMKLIASPHKGLWLMAYTMPSSCSVDH